MNSITILLLILSVVSCRADGDDPTLVTLPEGQIKGHTLLSANGAIYYAFQEIPYAEPPVDELRFQPPVPPKKWDGVLNTTRNTKICYQIQESYEVSDVEQTEDCLYLNVYTSVKPGDSSVTSLPVLIRIHGGGYYVGSGIRQIVNPDFFIDYNVVLVSLNYRLGPLGFLTTDDGVIPGNIGLKDQHLAIQWVKKNIHLFGGDSEKITISGESGGGSSVGLQLISHRNKGLFRGAILESGTGITQWSHQDYSRFYAFEMGRSLNPDFNSDDSKELLELLKNVPAANLSYNGIVSDIGKETGLIEGDGLIWLPVIEDENLEGAFLTGLPHENLRTGNINQVPILLGFNSAEELTFMVEDPTLPEKRAKYFDSDLSNLIRNKYNMTKENKLTAGSRLREIYTDGKFEDDLGAVVKFLSDDSFTIPMIRHAKLQSNYTDVYLYQFSYKGKMGRLPDLEIAGVTGVGHAEELGYLFDYLNDGTPDDPNDLITRHRLLKLWSNFVKYLNPTPEPDESFNDVIWEKVLPNKLVFLNINKTLDMQENPVTYIQWERVVDLYAIPPLVNY